MPFPIKYNLKINILFYLLGLLLLYYFDNNVLFIIFMIGGLIHIAKIISINKEKTDE